MVNTTSRYPMPLDIDKNYIESDGNRHIWVNAYEY